MEIFRKWFIFGLHQMEIFFLQRADAWDTQTYSGIVKESTQKNKRTNEWEKERRKERTRKKMQIHTHLFMRHILFRRVEQQMEPHIRKTVGETTINEFSIFHSQWIFIRLYFFFSCCYVLFFFFFNSVCFFFVLFLTLSDYFSSIMFAFLNEKNKQ